MSRRLLFVLVLSVAARASVWADEQSLIAALDRLPAKDAYSAAVELGRSKSAKGLTRLIDIGNAIAIANFAAGFSQTGEKQLPTDLEGILIDRFDRLQSIQPGLIDNLIGNTKYGQAALFDRLAAETRRVVDDLAEGREHAVATQAFMRMSIGMALVKTDLPVSDQIVAILKDVPPEPAAVSLRCALPRWLGDHSARQAIPALRDITRNTPDSDYSLPCLCEALTKLATPESFAAVFERLDRFSGGPQFDHVFGAVLVAMQRLPADTAIDHSRLARLIAAQTAPQNRSRFVQTHVALIRSQHDKAAVRELLAYLAMADVEESTQQAILYAILEVGSDADWRSAAEVLDRAADEHRIDSARHERLRRVIDARLDPEKFRKQQAERGVAAQEAGKRADAAVLEDLVARRDSAAIGQFALGLRSEDRAHLPPDVEAVIVRHFHDPGGIGDDVQRLVGPAGYAQKPSLYHSRELFDLFASEARPQRNAEVMGRLVSTDLPVEAELFALFQQPGLQNDSCELIKFLGAKRYPPLVAALTERIDSSNGPGGCAADALVEWGTADSLAPVMRRLARQPTRPTPAILGPLLRKLTSLPRDMPIDFAAIRRAVGDSQDELVVIEYVAFVQHRQPPEAVPDLLAWLSQRASGAELYQPALRALLAYDSPAVWKQTRAEIERLKKEGRIGEWSYQSAAASVDELLANPDQALAKRKLERPHPAGVALDKWDDDRLVEELSRSQGRAAADVARALGQHASAKGLAALLDAHDARGIGAFAEGLPQRSVLPADLQSIIAEHLADERLAAPLLGLISRRGYDDRRIFDWLARGIAKPGSDANERGVRAGVIGRTTLPVEGAVLELLERSPAAPSEVFTRCPLMRFLGERRYAPAVKPLAAILAKQNDSVSRCASTALAAIATRESLDAVTSYVAALRKDPAQAQLAEAIENEAIAAAKSLPPDAPPAFLDAKRARERPRSEPAPRTTPDRERQAALAALKDSLFGDAAKNASSIEERLDVLARGASAPDDSLAQLYFRLGSVVRFELKDPASAIRLYEKARPFERREAGPFVIDFPIADTYRFDLAKPAEAARYLRAIVADLNSRSAGRGDEEAILGGWKRWLEVEIAFLETRKPFTGKLDLQSGASSVYFSSMIASASADPNLSPLKEIAALDFRRATEPDRTKIREALKHFPPSEVLLFAALPFLHALDAEDLLAFLARNDPARYVSASLLALAAAEDHGHELGRQISRATLIPRPEPGERYAPSQMRIAAERFVKDNGIQVDAPPFVHEQASSLQEVDSKLRATWKALKDALRAGDVEKGLTFITSSRREDYRGVFTALKTKGANFDEIMTDVQKVRIDDADAEYAMLRSEHGQAFSYMVRFVRDADGVWRIESF